MVEESPPCFAKEFGQHDACNYCPFAKLCKIGCEDEEKRKKEGMTQ